MSLDVLKANRIAGSVTIEPNETIYDPVSKMRVSSPSNLIDTDFEYGLQSSKWETLELINNIPTFFARDGSLSLNITGMSATSGSNTISVTCSEEHGLVVGNSIIVKGANLAFADGTYVVLTTPTLNTFTYRARRASSVTGSIRDEATEIYLASLYQGTEFKLESLGAIATDGANPSTITITTNGPHGFSVGSTFILLNSLTSQQITFDARLVTSLIYTETQAIVRTDDSPTPNADGYIDQAFITFGTSGVVDPGIVGMTLVLDGDTAPESSAGIDNGTVRVMFPESMPFKLFDETFDRIWVNADGYVSFTNDITLLDNGPFVSSSTLSDNPQIRMFVGDHRLKKLYTSTTTTSLRIRWEGREYNDGGTAATIIWELTFDCENDTIDARLIKFTPISNAASYYDFKVIGRNNEAFGATINAASFFDPEQAWSRQVFIRTQRGAETTSSVNGYSANSLDLDNTSKFNPYTWTAEKYNFSPVAGASRPTLFFSLGKNASDLWTSKGIQDTNYITSTRFNVLNFNSAHYLRDNRPYLYNPGVLNGGLTIAGSQVTAPTIYYVRTKPGFYNGNTTTGTATLNQTGTATSYSIAGNTLTVGGTITGTAFDVGAYITDTNYGYIPAGTYIVARGTGTGGAGTYIINRPLTVGTTADTLNAARNIVTVAATTNMVPGAAIRFTPGTAVTPFLNTHIQGPTVTAGHFSIGSPYTIAALGTTTQPQWNTIAGTSGVTYAVGSAFTAATNGAASGTGTANGSLGGIGPGSAGIVPVYYVKDVLSATQITISDTATTNVNDSSAAPKTLTNPVAMGTATVGAFTVQIGTIITDSTTQAVLVTQANRRTALAVNFGVQAAAARFPLATDRFGPHSFMAAARVHDYQTIAGTNYLQLPDTQNAAIQDNQPFVVWTTAFGGSTASTNNWTPSQLSNILYARNVNSDSHNTQVVLPFGATQGSNTAPGNANFSSYGGNNGEVDGAIGTIAAAAADATTLSLTFDEGAVSMVTGTTVTTNIITVLSTTGMKVGQLIQFNQSVGGLSSSQYYYILSIPSGTTLTVSATRGGAAVALSTTTVQRVACWSWGPFQPYWGSYYSGYTFGGDPAGSFLGAGNVTSIVTGTSTSGNLLNFADSIVGLTVNQPFTVSASMGGLVSGTTYYVKTIGSSSITLSASAGGAEFTITSNTSGLSNTFTSAGLRNTPKGHEIYLRNNDAVYQSYEVSPFGEWNETWGSTNKVRGIITGHTGTTTRTLTIKLVNPLNNAVTLQTNNVGFDLYGSASASVLTLNTSTTSGGSTLALTGATPDGYIVPINNEIPYARGRSWYSKNHGFQNNDLIFWEGAASNAASIPTGLTNRAYFIVDSATTDRFRLLSDASVAVAVTSAAGANLDTANPFADKTILATNTTRDTAYWVWRTSAVAAAGTSQTLTLPSSAWTNTVKDAGNVVVPNITAGQNTFIWTSAARPAGGSLLPNIAHHGGLIKFYDTNNQPLKMGTPWGIGQTYTLNQKVHYGNNLYNVAVAGTTAPTGQAHSPPTHTSGTVTEYYGTAELTYIGDCRFNAYDIRVGLVEGTAPATSVTVYVMNPGGLPGTFATTSTNKIVIDTGHSVRDEDNLTLGTSWLQSENNFAHIRDNSVFPMVGAQISDYWEHIKIPSTTLKKGSITAITPGADNSVTYTFPSNSVTIASIRRDNNVATVTTAVPHGFKEGTQVAIGQVTSVTDATFNNATAIILSATYNTFTYANTGTNGAVSANGTASQLIHNITPKVLAITAFTSNSQANATTATHGVPIGAVVPIHFQGFANAASAWYALWDNKVYYAKATTTTALDIFKDSAATDPLSTAGFAAYNNGTDVGRIWFLGAKINFVGNNHYFTKRASNTDGDTIYKASHGLNAGTAVTYATGGGTEVGGLTAGSTKFVFNPTTDRFNLADTAAGWSTNAIAITQSAANMVVATGVITTATNTFTTGRQVQYLSATPPAGLTNGAFYYVRNLSATTCTLFWTQNGAINDLADDRVKFVGTPSGTGTLREALLVDIVNEGTGTAHSLTTGVTTGAIDGLYTIANVAPSGNTSKFTLNNPTGALIPKRILGINPQTNVDFYWNAIYSLGHKLITGTPVVYTTSGTALGPLVSGNTYYIIKVTEDWFRLADSVANATNPVVIPLNLNSGNFLGSGNHQFEASSVVGSIQGAGNIVLAAGTTKIIGNNTNFSTAFKSGDNFYWNYPAVFTAKTTTFTTSTFTSAGHLMLTGMSIRWNSTVTAPTGLINGGIYYVRWIDANTFSLHSTYNDAVAGTNLIVATGGAGTNTVSLIVPGNTGVSTINTVNSRTVLNLVDTIPIAEQYRLPVSSVSTVVGTTLTINFPMPCPFPVGSVIVLTGTGNSTLIDNIPLTVASNAGSNSVTITATLQVAAAAIATIPATTTASTVSGIFCHGFPANNTYDVTSSLLLRADSSATHRPYDGGVELIATDSPNARVIRQTRKYFRYQSGKGIQVSFAINFSPSVPINQIVGNSGSSFATVTTRVPHRCTAGLQIAISGDTNSYFSGSYTIGSIVDDYTFTITTSYLFSNYVSAGRPNFYAQSWSDATISCGLFDGQNGLFFEYTGSVLNVCRRNSTTQLGGTATVTFNSNLVTGLNTQYLTEIAAGDFVVIRGMSYKVIEIPNNTQFYIQPSYRGVTATNVVVSKTQETRVPQSQWNLDPCNGSGPTGYNLDKNKIQMAYIDYSWYGAGKVRFGFKTTDGVVRYVHQLVHNNSETEAYLRSGNLPARYEVNTGNNPTFIPKLAHWGTSVIMDGGFDDDKAYLFSATSNQIRTTTGTTASISVTTAGTTAAPSNPLTANQLIIGRSYTIATVGTTTWTTYGAGANTVGTNFIATSVAASAIAAGTGTVFAVEKWYAYNNGGKLIGEIGYAVEIATHSDTYFSIGANSSITGTGLNAGTLTANPSNATIGSQPYLRQVRVSPTSNILKNLLVINARPSSGFATANGSYTVTQNVDLSKTIPLLSVRLSPSVDNGIPGALGAREIINRMQLNLKALDVLSTHEVEVSLVLNADLDNLEWKRVTTPSLSQVVYHNIADTIDQGSTIFTFRVPPGTTNSTPSNQRAQSLTTIDLREITTMGNAIMGGNGVYPDGPDVLTLRLRYIGLTADVSATSAFVTSCRLSWTESQA